MVRYSFFLPPLFLSLCPFPLTSEENLSSLRP
jgi:hypothetical protein